MKLQYFPLLLLLNFLSLDKYPLCNLTQLYLHVIRVKPICISSLFDSTLSYLAHPTDCNVRSPQSSFSLTPKYSAGYLFTIEVRGSACFLVKLLFLSATPSPPPPPHLRVVVVSRNPGNHLTTVVCYILLLFLF